MSRIQHETQCSLFRCLFFGIQKKNTEYSSQISKSCESSGFNNVTDIGEYPGTSLESIGVDWIGKNIFWTNKKNHAIEVVNYSGTLHQTLDIIHRNESHVLENPRGLAVDSSHGMYFYKNY